MALDTSLYVASLELVCVTFAKRGPLSAGKGQANSRIPI